MKIGISKWPSWLFSQVGQFLIAVLLISLLFNYAYRFLIDWSINSPLFYTSTIVLGIVVYVVFRREYILIREYEFTEQEIIVRTMLGVVRTYPVGVYRFVPSLHKVVNFPEKEAGLSFYIQETKSGRNTRNYTWSGFSPEDFRTVSQMYGYEGRLDFRLKDFGR